MHPVISISIVVMSMLLAHLPLFQEHIAIYLLIVMHWGYSSKREPKDLPLPLYSMSWTVIHPLIHHLIAQFSTLPVTVKTGERKEQSRHMKLDSRHPVLIHYKGRQGMLDIDNIKWHRLKMMLVIASLLPSNNIQLLVLTYSAVKHPRKL